MRTLKEFPAFLLSRLEEANYLKKLAMDRDSARDNKPADSLRVNQWPPTLAHTSMFWSGNDLLSTDLSSALNDLGVPRPASGLSIASSSSFLSGNLRPADDKNAPRAVQGVEKLLPHLGSTAAAMAKTCGDPNSLPHALTILQSRLMNTGAEWLRYRVDSNKRRHQAALRILKEILVPAYDVEIGRLEIIHQSHAKPYLVRTVKKAMKCTQHRIIVLQENSRSGDERRRQSHSCSCSEIAQGHNRTALAATEIGMDACGAAISACLTEAVTLWALMDIDEVSIFDRSG
jgi:hypothetical protein